MNELKPLLDLLTGKLPWLPTLIIWIGALKVAFYLIGNTITKWAASKISDIVESSDVEDDHFLERFLSSRFYIALRFVLLLFSLPLPSRADYEAAYLRKIGQAPNGNRLALLLLLVPALFLNSSCASQMELGGAYAPAITNEAGVVANAVAPDIAFFRTDSAFKATHVLLTAAFTFEKENRDYLWKLSPEIKHGLDRIRPTAQECVIDYALARKIYKANPVPANLPRLESVLHRLSTLNSIATELLPKE